MATQTRTAKFKNLINGKDGYCACFPYNSYDTQPLLYKGVYSEFTLDYFFNASMLFDMEYVDNYEAVYPITFENLVTNANPNCSKINERMRLCSLNSWIFYPLCITGLYYNGRYKSINYEIVAVNYVTKTIMRKGRLIGLSNNGGNLTPSSVDYPSYFEAVKGQKIYVAIGNNTDYKYISFIVMRPWGTGWNNVKQDFFIDFAISDITTTLPTPDPPMPVPPPPPTDPFDPGGTTKPGGGDGTFSETSEPIDFPSLPTVTAVDTGFIGIFNPTLSQLNELATYMWSNLFDVQGWQKLFANPMDCILGLSMLPLAIPSSGTANVTVGNISTGVSMDRASNQFLELDCGTITVQDYSNSYLDYAPYTKLEIYLPYCGTHPLDVDECMGKALHVKYHVDILSGACLAYVKCGDSVLYQFSGACAMNIPITATNWANAVQGAITIAASIGAMAASGGMSAPVSASAAVSATATTASTVTDMKPSIEKSGSISGASGLLAIQKPYIIVTRPNQALPKNQNKYAGYPSLITAKLSEMKGFTSIHDIQLQGVPCTADESARITEILKQGVII